MMQNLLARGLEPATLTRNFLSPRPRYTKYNLYFGVCKFLNLMMMVLSIVMTNALLLGKFCPEAKTPSTTYSPQSTPG